MKKKHSRKCRCAACSGRFKSLKKLHLWQQTQIRQHGFYIHYAETEEGPNLLNAHTHGFEETWKHPDVQLVLALPEETVSHIFWNIAERLTSGETFVTGGIYEKIVEGFRVKMTSAEEGKRSVLRILLPDAEGRLPGEKGCAAFFEQQLYVLGGVQEKRN